MAEPISSPAIASPSSPSRTRSSSQEALAAFARGPAPPAVGPSAGMPAAADWAAPIDQFVALGPADERLQRGARLLLRGLASPALAPPRLASLRQALGRACGLPAAALAPEPFARAALTGIAIGTASCLYARLSGQDGDDAAGECGDAAAIADILQALCARGGLEEMVASGPLLGALTGNGLPLLERAWRLRLGRLAAEL